MIDWTDVNGVSLRYELAGTGERTLILLHEMGGTLETWDAVVDRFPDFRVLRFDMRGAGLSQKIRTLSFDELIEDLRSLLDALGIDDPVSIAGVAVGAAVAVGFAARYPSRVENLTLMSPATGIPQERQEATIAIAESIRGGGLRGRVEARLDATYPARFRTDPGRFRAFRGRAIGNDPVSYAAYYQMLLQLDLTTDLEALCCRALVLAGSEDGTRPPERVACDAGMIKGAVFETLLSGHVMPVLTPDLVADRIRAFLRCARRLPSS
ncbi:alpha/beta fold hydrolase [Microvirga alba]|uniref:Alpha/beta fold hydrolase n=1 Tax=Microvirga alba TaxID=2791025 RepID=A0A931BU40_9HYPH|nr:alpha/beta hydrolase [Microvirga alba]MBF9233845.1 alpha/beta fold hydrolase [Microvirga alba]